MQLQRYKSVLALFAAATFVVVAPAFADERRYGLDDMLKDTGIDGIHPTESRGLTSDDLDSPSRRQRKQESQPREASVAPAAAPAIDWHAVTQEAFKKHQQPERVAAAKEPEAELPTAVSSKPQDRLVRSASENPKPAPRRDLAAPQVSDLARFQARAIQSEVVVPEKPGSDDAPRHDVFAGRRKVILFIGHSQGYTQGSSAP